MNITRSAKPFLDRAQQKAHTFTMSYSVDIDQDILKFRASNSCHKRVFLRGVKKISNSAQWNVTTYLISLTSYF